MLLPPVSARGATPTTFFKKNIFYISKDSITLTLIENYKKTEEK
jgi:hypothetical protein